MTGFFIKLAALAAAGALLGASAAADDPVYLKEFDAYNAALEQGDAGAARAHGYAAWQAAEADLGDHRLTAILAYNYGSLAIYDDPAKANEALTRAKELADAGLAELPVADLDLYLAYTAFKLNEDGRSEANALRSQLEQLAAENIPPSRDTANMWFELAAADVQTKRYRAAEESAKRAETYVASVYPENYRMRALSRIFGGIAKLMPMPRTETRVIEALELFQGAVTLFPSQESIDNFDDVLATAFAWQATAGSVYQSNNFRESRLPEPKPDSGSPLFAGEHLSLEECGSAWAEREAPRYPRKELYRGYLGAVVIGYRFGDDIAVHDARILAEVPTGVFGEDVLKEVSNWKLTAPLPDDPRCRGDRITWVTFVIEN